LAAILNSGVLASLRGSSIFLSLQRRANLTRLQVNQITTNTPILPHHLWTRRLQYLRPVLAKLPPPVDKSCHRVPRHTCQPCNPLDVRLTPVARIELAFNRLLGSPGNPVAASIFVGTSVHCSYRVMGKPFLFVVTVLPAGSRLSASTLPT